MALGEARKMAHKNGLTVLKFTFVMINHNKIYLSVFISNVHYSLSSDSTQQIVISQTPGGAIQIHTDWAKYLTNKGVYFIKRENQGIPEPEYGPLLNFITCGDVHANVIGNNQFPHEF